MRDDDTIELIVEALVEVTMVNLWTRIADDASDDANSCSRLHHSLLRLRHRRQQTKAIELTDSDYSVY